jgi:hypothetical protein
VRSGLTHHLRDASPGSRWAILATMMSKGGELFFRDIDV